MFTPNHDVYMFMFRRIWNIYDVFQNLWAYYCDHYKFLIKMILKLLIYDLITTFNNIILS